MAQTAEKICPYCQARVQPGEQLVECSQCGVPHHEECWKENGGCTVYGCKGWALWPGLNVASREDRNVERVDLTKVKSREFVLACPVCKARITKGMTQCGACGYELPRWMLGRYVIEIPWWVVLAGGLVLVGGIAFAAYRFILGY